MNIKAKLLEKSATQQVTDSFKKREFVVEFAENTQYPEYIKFELIQANCDQLDQFQLGEIINISFNLKGRKWNDPKSGETKYFNSLQAWRLERDGASTTPTAPSTTPPAANEPWENQTFTEDDVLPF